MKKIKIKDYLDWMGFTVITTGGKCFVCPGFWEVPMGTRMEDVEFLGKRPESVDPFKRVDKEWSVPGSGKSGAWSVTRRKEVWNCNCPAKSFRRGDCKHIKSIKEKEIN
jgi:hypothetical protein